MAEMHNIDDLLVMGSDSVDIVTPIVDISKSTEDEKTAPLQVENQQNTADSETKAEDGSTLSSGTDEYGNEVTQEQSMISLEEHERRVNEIIRKRIKNWSPEAQEQVLSNMQPAQQPIQQAQEGEVDWQQELKSLVKNVMTETQEEARRIAWQQEQMLQQQQFESKFNIGAAKYSDFEPVVMDKQLTSAMLLATKSMQDPAAFMYAACKTQPQEIERISKIVDPMEQAVEMGRLEERMRKVRAISKAAAPLDPTNGDIAEKPGQKYRDIDSLIHHHANHRRR